jgi:hypothetical protein
MKTKWTSKVPKQDGWFWVKYKGKRGVVICPALVLWFRKAESKPVGLISTARNDSIRSDNLEGLKFGPIIPFPA